MNFDPITYSEAHALHEHFKLIYGSYDATLFVFDAAVTGASLEAWFGTPANLAAFRQLVSTYVGPAAMIANTTTWAAVIASSTAMAAVAASSTAMATVAASSTAMAAVAASSTAMAAVAASSTAMAAVIASSTARSAIISKNSNFQTVRSTLKTMVTEKWVKKAALSAAAVTSVNAIVAAPAGLVFATLGYYANSASQSTSIFHPGGSLAANAASTQKPTTVISVDGVSFNGATFTETGDGYVAVELWSPT